VSIAGKRMASSQGVESSLRGFGGETLDTDDSDGRRSQPIRHTRPLRARHIKAVVTGEVPESCHTVGVRFVMSTMSVVGQRL
jgi:hypothetical protein